VPEKSSVFIVVPILSSVAVRAFVGVGFKNLVPLQEFLDDT
jgi:hypothetical protein